MKNVVLVHGLNGVTKMDDWLKRELEENGVDVALPSFPLREEATYEKWVGVMDSAGALTDETIVICHSIGNAFLIKYIAEKKFKIDTYIGLAGFAKVFSHDGEDVLNTAIKDFAVTNEEIRAFVMSTKKRYAFYSDNDSVIPDDIREEYPRTIDAVPVLIHGVGHMGSRSGLENFQELLDLIKSCL